MLRILTIVFIFSSGVTSAQYNLEYFRTQFHTGSSEENLQNLIKLGPTEEDPTNINIISAYKAVCETMMASHAFLPTSKLNYFHTGAKQLEGIIKETPVLEVRYLRLLVQLNVPKMLNYNDDIDSDLKFVVDNIGSSKLSEQDKELIKNTLSKATENPTYLNTIKTIY